MHDFMEAPGDEFRRPSSLCLRFIAPIRGGLASRQRSSWTRARISDHQLEVIPYAGSGFGVKAKPLTGGSVDLFDARAESEARDFAANAAVLIASCSRS
jgi:hypothetical protein